MINVTLIHGSNQYAAAHYFSAADDYYATKEGEGDGRDASAWQGGGASELGLEGPVNQTQFSRLLSGMLPDGSHIATAGVKRMGWDITFSAPKSISLQALVAQDPRIAEAHDRAVSVALAHIETLAMTRKKVNGESARERTGNLVIAKFRHALSRDKDPQLHTHAVVLNMTKRSDGEWRALDAADFYRAQRIAEAIYKNELSLGIQALGYEIRLTDAEGNFELSHISRDQIEAFSARSAAIEAVLSERGKSRATASPEEKQEIALATRKRKEKKIDIPSLQKIWANRSDELGIDYLGPRPANEFTPSLSNERPGVLPTNEGRAGQRTPSPDVPSPARDSQAGGSRNNAPDADKGQTGIERSDYNRMLANTIVRWSIKHLTEREACVPENVLVETAMKRAVGLNVRTAHVLEEIKRQQLEGGIILGPDMYSPAGGGDSKSYSPAGWVEKMRSERHWDLERAKRYVERSIADGVLVRRERSFTTPKALKQEKACLAIERNGRGSVAPLMERAAIEKELAHTDLNEGQREAVRTILGTRNRFVGIQGDAGTGKTYAVKHAAEIIQKNLLGSGYTVRALAPYGNQVKALKNDGLDAKTLASFLYSRDKKIDGKTVVVLDESAVVGTRQMSVLMRIIEDSGARLVMLGDTKQTEAIEAGKPFAQLQYAGMETARISEILRQSEPTLKKAVEKVVEGKVHESIGRLSVVEIENPAKRHKQMVADFMKMKPEDRENTLVIAGTNVDRTEINQMIRRGLNLEGKGREIDVLARVDMTQAQRRVADQYAPGMIIQPERDYPKIGLTRWRNYKVIGSKKGNLLEVQSEKDGSMLTINPRKVAQLSVYNLERPEMAVGDIVRVTRNDIGLDFTNGDRLRVVGVSPGIITVQRFNSDDEKPIELATTTPLHIVHAYSSTVHSSQGMTCKNALISMSAFSRTTSRNIYYVAISRAKEFARIYTDEARKLPGQIERLFTKTTAMSLARDRLMNRHIPTPHVPQAHRQEHVKQDKQLDRGIGRS